MSKISRMNKKKQQNIKPETQYTDEQLLKQYMNLIHKLYNYDDNKHFVEPQKEKYSDILKRLDIIYNKLNDLGIHVQPYHNRKLH